MKRIMKVLGIVIGLLAIVFVVVAVAGRFADGPIVEMLPGGPLTSGEWVREEPPDWGFVADEMFIEFESDGRSRKTFVLTLDGKAFIPASLGFPPFKTWHKRALQNPEAIVRIAGKRYARRLHKIDDAGLEARLIEQVDEKYGGGPDPEAGVWFFRLDPPS